MHDNQMPKGWHTIKLVLLTEIHNAANFHLCIKAADALFHARLIGESSAKESQRFSDQNPATTEATGSNPKASEQQS